MKFYLAFLLCSLSLNSFSQVVEILKTSNIEAKHVEEDSATNYTFKVRNKVVGAVSVDLRNHTCQFQLLINESVRYFELEDKDKCIKIYDAIHSFVDNFLHIPGDYVEIRYEVDNAFDQIAMNSIMIIDLGDVSFVELNLTNM